MVPNHSEQGLVVEGLLHQLPQAVQLMGLDFPVAGAGLEVRVAVTFGAISLSIR
jgi:hypothetical protein